LLFAGGAVILVLVLLLALGAFSGGGSASKGATGATAAGTAASASSAAKKTKPASTHHAASSAAGAASPAETNVAVLNGTETTGLAHRVAGELVQMGYSKAAALGGRPEGSNQVTVVDYTSGHKADATAVAQRLGVSTVQPIEGSASALAPSANVVVIVGLDKASSGP
jgi:hypothetical protein